MRQLMNIMKCIAAVLMLVVLGACQEGPVPAPPEQLEIIVTSGIYGQAETCGCSLGQAGGMLRMATLVRKAKEAAADRDILLIDCGHFKSPKGSMTPAVMDEIVMQTITDLGYTQVGLSHEELVLPVWQLDLLFNPSVGTECFEDEMPYTVTNLQMSSGDPVPEYFPPYRVASLENGYRIGFLHLIGEGSEGQDIYRDYILTDPIQAVRETLSNYGDAADMWIVTACDFAEGYDPDWSEVGSDKLLLLIGIGGETQIVSGERIPLPVSVDLPPTNAVAFLHLVCGFKGSVLKTFQNNFEFVPDTTEPDAFVVQCLEEARERLEREEDELAREAIAKEPNGPRYIGHDVCAGCHPAIADQLVTSGHAHAYETLVEKGVERNGACLPCHVVGRNEPGGWNVIDNPPVMQGVHCENCHGPGEYHAALMQGQAGEAATAYAEEHPSALAGEPFDCISCHTPVNSTAFNLDEYWARIAHGQ